MENIEENVIGDIVETAETTLSLLWRKTAKKKKDRIPFVQFADEYNKKNGNFKNLKATDKIIQDASFNKGESQLQEQIQSTKESGDTFYTLNTMQSDIMLPVNRGSEITDKGVMMTTTTDSPEDATATADAAAPMQPEGDKALILFFLFGAMVGIASVIIAKKYSK